MILLKGHSLEQARKVPLEKMSLQLSERDSTASIQPAEITGIGIDSWMQDDTEPGKGIVWRVKSIRRAYGEKTVTVQLEHAVNTLKDLILFGEVTAKEITGNSKATTCTAKQAVQFILKKQKDWTLGTFSFTDSNPYKFDGDTLMDALGKVSDSLEGCVWEYDFTSYPFKLNILKESDVTGSVLRAGRNLTAVSKTIDRSGMYTRFYPIGKDDLHITGDYVERNTSLYGVVSKTDTDQTLDTEKELKRWARERLRKHAEPVVTIDVEGVELSRQTGEPLDKLKLLRKCWVPLPEFGTEILETVRQLNYPDKIHQKDVFRATLANKRTDATKIIADAIKKGGGGGRAAARQQKEDHAWFEDTNDHVSMCAKGIIGVDAKGNPNWERLSRLDVSEGGIESQVRGVQKGLTIAESNIKQNENEISLSVKKNGVISAINMTSESIQIQARRINLTGYVTASELAVTNASIERLMTGRATATLIRAGSIQTGTLRVGGTACSWRETLIPDVGWIHYLGY